MARSLAFIASMAWNPSKSAGVDSHNARWARNLLAFGDLPRVPSSGNLAVPDAWASPDEMTKAEQ
jgi:hypothetical protein